MNGKITIRKAANALLVLFISTSHVTTATEIDERPPVDLPGVLGELGNGREKHTFSKQFRDHGYYKTELQKLEESTRRIHEEVDRILAEFRKNMEEYRNHTRGTGTIPTLDQQQKAREEAEQKVADEKAAAQETVRVKAAEEAKEREERKKTEKTAAERKAAEKAAQLKAEKEAKEREEREKTEKAAAEKKAAEKAAQLKAEKEAKEREEQRKAEEAQKLAERNASSELVRGNSYYQRELEKLAESTRRIHEEVDRILAEFRKNMEEYYWRTRGAWMKNTPTTTMPETVENKADEQEANIEAKQKKKKGPQNQSNSHVTSEPGGNTGSRQASSRFPSQAPRVNIRSSDTPPPQIRSKDRSEKAQEITSMLTQLTFWRLTKDQQDELENLILTKLDGFKGAEFLAENMKKKLIADLNKASSFEGVKAILERGIKSPTVLLKTDFLTDEGMKKRDALIQAEKLATIGHMYQDQINKDTAQVMKESGIQGWITKLSETDRKVIESDIKRIVTKLYDKSVPNLTGGASPLKPLIEAFKKVNTLEGFKKEVAKFEEEEEEFKKIVEKGKKSEELTVDMDAIASTVPMEFRPMISKQNSFLINDIDALETSSLLKFKDGKNSTEAAEFEKLKTSERTGFVVVPVGSETSTQQINMKVFSLGIEEKFSLTLPQKGVINPKKQVTNPQPFQEVKYYKVTSTSSAQELQTLKDKLSDGRYELWSLPGDDRGRLFFAISRDSSQPVISFSLNKGDPRLQGTVYNHIDMAKFLMSGQKGPFQGGVVGAIKEMHSKK